MEEEPPEHTTKDVEPETEPDEVLELSGRTYLPEPIVMKDYLRVTYEKDEEEEGDEEEEELWEGEEPDDGVHRGKGDAKSRNISQLSLAVNIRRTIAEDLLWTLRTVPRLDELVLKHFIRTFAGMSTSRSFDINVFRSDVVIWQRGKQVEAVAI